MYNLDTLCIEYNKPVESDNVYHQPIKSAGGRPSVIDDVVVTKLVAAFQNGMNVRSACQYAKISHRAFYEKCQKDEKFRDTMQDARDFLKLQAGQRVSQIITKGSDRDAGPMARWFLEKTMPDVYGNKPQIQQNVQQNYFVLDKEQIDELCKMPEIANCSPVELLELLEKADEEEPNNENTSV